MASENQALAEDIQVSGLADSDVNLAVGEEKDNSNTMDNGGVAGQVGHEGTEKHDIGRSQPTEDSNTTAPNESHETIEAIIKTEINGVDISTDKTEGVTEKLESNDEPAGTDSQSATTESIWTTKRDGSVQIRYLMVSHSHV